MGDSWVFVCMMMVTLCTLAPQTASSDAFPEHLRKYFFASQVRYWISSRIISYCFYPILYSHIVSYFILLRKIILIEKYENYYFKNWNYYLKLKLLFCEIIICIWWNYYLYLEWFCSTTILQKCFFFFVIMYSFIVNMTDHLSALHTKILFFNSGELRKRADQDMVPWNIDRLHGKWLPLSINYGILNKLWAIPSTSILTNSVENSEMFICGFFVVATLNKLWAVTSASLSINYGPLLLLLSWLNLVWKFWNCLFAEIDSFQMKWILFICIGGLRWFFGSRAALGWTSRHVIEKLQSARKEYFTRILH